MDSMKISIVKNANYIFAIHNMNESVYKDIKDVMTKNTGKKFIAIHGPQGIGKSTLCIYLKEKLSRDGYRVCCMSLDDFYYELEDMKRILQELNHELYTFRGLAGTHNLTRLCSCLDDLKADKDTNIPVFNKELQGGFGDVEHYISLTGIYDIIILEGWMLGYKPISHPPQQLNLFNDQLQNYKRLHAYFDTWINIETDDIENIFHWRLKAEPAKGMNRNMFQNFMKPYYEVYRNYHCNIGKKYIINKNREIISHTSLDF